MLRFPNYAHFYSCPVMTDSFTTINEAALGAAPGDVTRVEPWRGSHAAGTDERSERVPARALVAPPYHRP